MHLNIIDDMADLILVGAYWVKDILWLRLLAIVGSFVVIPYYLLQADPLWTPMMWSGVFISINATRAWGIIKERRPITLSDDERLLYDKTFNAYRHRGTAARQRVPVDPIWSDGGLQSAKKIC